MANEIFFDIIKVWWGELAYTHDFLINAKNKYEYQPKSTPKKRAVIGVDIDINVLGTCSDGSKLANVKAHKQAKKRQAH